VYQIKDIARDFLGFAIIVKKEILKS